MPKHVQDAIVNGKKKAKHSEFYYKLRGLNEKINLYTKLFYNRVPAYQRAYMQKRVMEKQEKQRREREAFEKEL